MFHPHLAEVTMNGTGPGQDHSIRIQIQVENVVYCLKLCFMFLPKTEQSFGITLQTYTNFCSLMTAIVCIIRFEFVYELIAIHFT